jgi:imidazolonepropionase-like amidohydrolase
MRLKTILWVFFSALFLAVGAQETVPLNGVKTPVHAVYALTNGHIVMSSTTEFSNGSLIIQDGKVLAVGENLEIPHHAIIYDLQGKYVYPSFIDLYSNYGLGKIPARKKTVKPQYGSLNNGTLYWNDAIHPQVDAVKGFNWDKKSAESLAKLGFGVTLTHQFNGIMRGTAALVSLGNNESGSAILKSKAAAFYGYGKGNSSQTYPTSLMGSIALFRQAMYDGQWYQAKENPTVNYSLQAMNDNQDLPQFFDAKNYQSILRTSQIAKEFDLNVIATGGGDEYKRVEEIKESGLSLIIPLNFPKPFDVADPFDAEYVSLEDMKHWELAPSNPAILAEKEVEFAISSYANPKEFWKFLRLSIQYGLSPEKALAALTEVPAKYLNMSDEVGTLETGKLANFFITDEDVFTTKSKVLENWTMGKRNVYKNAFAINPTGNYNMNFGGVLYQMNIIETKNGFAISTSMGGTKEAPQKGAISIENDLLTLKFENGNHQHQGPIRMVGKVNFKGKIIDGKAQDAKGDWCEWTAIKQKSISLATYGDSVKTITQIGEVLFPNMAYGDTVLPEANNYFIKNVTVWTSDSTGNFRGMVAISNGKIEAVGKQLSNPGYQEINGNGMHLTPGLIDEHSHISIKQGVNEYGQNNSAEVRIGDVLNPDDINMYRQLAGGVTTSQLLHGSANPIGGQAQIIKLRWGMGAEGLKIASNAKSIKFALGENVTQSNGDFRSTSRFPQTRMGVEQVYVDAFTRAQAYKEEWESFNGATKKELKNGAGSPRRDLELDALVEILNDERFITCHSYIKSEITMLINVADSMNFRVNTFTHILEGYKIADKIKQHGAYASTFSDWWAYKFEVNDAIPYNAAILSAKGVVTAINSDDAEMGRRLNQEAAKTVKYGGVSEIEALKMITINPAKMLHIDDQVGSITVGKDADLVLWSGHPLSVYTHAEMVMIDGAIFYSTEKNNALMAQMKLERQRLINAMIKAKDKGSVTQKVKPKSPKQYHCDSFHDETNF